MGRWRKERDMSKGLLVEAPARDAHDNIETKRPSASLRRALDELEQMIEDPSIGKSYTDVNEMMTELLADVHD